MTKAICHEDAAGNFHATISCECGSTITHSNRSGMFCSNPDCNIEKLSKNIYMDIFQNDVWDPNKNSWR